MTHGRPTKYDPAYCEKVLQWGREGKSRTWMIAEVGVVKQTFVNWEREHPEFAEAMELAMMLSQQWWEDVGQNNLTTPGFQGSMYTRTMGSRFKEDWCETQRRELTGADGAPLTAIVRKVVDVGSNAGD